MVYADTSVIVKLYIREQFSRETAAWIKQNDEALPLTPFHDLEFTNAIRLKQFRREMTPEEVDSVFKKLREHEKKGVFYRPQINWADVFNRTLHLSNTHTHNIGSRSLDVIHVALALSIGANRMLTFDDRQSQSASAAGIRIDIPEKTPPR